MTRSGLLLAFLLYTGPSLAEPARGAMPPTVSVCFTPGQDCEARVVQAIDEAKNTVRVQAYSFTSVPIMDALKSASNRSVRVQVILDKSNDKAKAGAAEFLANANIPVFIDQTQGIAHSKGGLSP